MDLSKELDKLKNGSIADLLAEIYEEKLILDKKTHILEIMNLIKATENMFSSNFVEEKSIEFVSFGLENDYDYTQSMLTYKLYTKGKERVYLDKPDKDMSMFSSAVSSLMNFDNNFINHNFYSEEILISKDDNIEEILTNKLLNDELRTSLNYAKIKSSVETTDKINVKRKKI